MAHTPYYDHANLTLRLPDFPSSPNGRKRRRSSRPQSQGTNLLEVPRPASGSDAMSMRSDSSKTITPSATIRSSPRTTPRNFETPTNTPQATPTSLSGPPSLRSSPPFDPARAPTSSIFHVRPPGSSHRHNYNYHQRDYAASRQFEQPPQQPDTPILSPSDDIIFPPSNSSSGIRRDSRRMTPGRLGYNLQSMGLGPDTPPVSPTPSPLVLSEARADDGGDYFSQNRTAALQITPPNDEESEEDPGYFPRKNRMVATCVSTVAGSISMQRWLRE
jgi:hypothetical protein